MKHYQSVIQGEYESRVMPFLWQKGESKEIIEDYLIKMKDCDIREFCLESRPHPEFCEDGWWSDVAFIIEKCKELGLKFWLLDDSHFPTGYANGWIKDKAVQHRKWVLTHREFDLVGPQKHQSIYLKNMFDPTEEFYGAVLIQDKTSLPLSYTIQDDQLIFDVPEGMVKVCVMFTSRQSGFRDDYINMIDYDSCHVLIEAVYEPHYGHFKEEFGNIILGFFSDEPGFMNEKGNQADSLIGKQTMALPWSTALEARLKDALQENFMTSLPALWLDVESHACIRHTYMDHVTTLYKECFDEQLGNWCRTHGVMHIGHVIEDKDAHARLGIGAGHYFRALAGQDMAGVDIVINQLVPGMDEGMHSYGRGQWDMEFFNYALAKLGSSLAHIDPLKQGRCMAEVFGAFGWHEGLKEMKWIADHFLVRGVNYFVPHAFSQASFPDVDCPPHFYAHGYNPQFRYFSTLMRYMNQMGTLLSDGMPHPTTAILYHADGEWCGDILPMQKVAKVLSRNQIDFDFVPVDALLDTNCELNEDTLIINGISYVCLLIPYQAYIGKEMAAFLKKANALHFPVYYVEGTPKEVYDDAKPFDASGCTSVSLGQLAQTLQDAALCECRITTYEPWLRYYHYTKHQEDYIMFVNEHPHRSIDTQVEHLTGVKINLMEHTEVMFDGHLVLEPYESCLIIVNETCDEKEGEVTPFMELQGPWKHSFATSLAYPTFEVEGEVTTLAELCPIQMRSGTFAYETTFTLAQNEANLQLNIEEAYETVEVFVDGKSIDHRIAPPYRFLLPSMQAGTHDLRIEVTNTLDKEIHDMFSLTEAAEPSGLVGPVILLK